MDEHQSSPTDTNVVEQETQAQGTETSARTHRWGCLWLLLPLTIFLLALVWLSGPSLFARAGRILAAKLPCDQQIELDQPLLDVRLQVWPGRVSVQNVATKASWTSHRPDPALLLLGLGLGLWPNSAELHNTLGEIYYTKNQPAQAIHHFQQAVKKDGNLAVARNNLGAVLISQNRSQEALAHLQRAIELNPENPQAYQNLGSALMETGSLEEAIQAYQGAIDLDASVPNAWALQGLAYLNLEELESAQGAFQKAIEIDPKHRLALQGLGVIATHQGEAYQALMYLEQVKKLGSTDADTHLYLGLAYMALNKTEQAIIAFERAKQLSQDPAQIELVNAHLEKLSKVSQATDEGQGGEPKTYP